MSNFDKSPAPEYLLSTLGLKGTIEMVELALPAIKAWKASFAEPLVNNDIDLAASYAHKALGSVRLYGTKRLEDLLSQVHDKRFDAAMLGQILRDVRNEFHLIYEKLSRWLDTQK